MLPAAIWALALVGVIADVHLMAWYWPGSFFDTITSGEWIALASDFAHGEFYRPLFGNGGYGGTRFMPLFFIVHGLLIRAGFDPIISGVVLMQTTVVLAAVAAFTAFKAVGVPTRLALPLGCTVWATILYQKVCTDIRADYLAAAIAVFMVAALAVGVRPGKSRWIVVAAIACVLMGITKVTSIAFTAAPIVWLWRSGRRSTAVRFAIGTAALYVSTIAVFQWWSAGHFIENFLNSADGGTTAADLLAAPAKLARWIAIEPTVAVPFVVACWRIVTKRAIGPSLFNAYFVTVVLVTLFIYGSPGTNSNQTIDLQVAGVLVMGETLARGEVPQLAGALAYGALAGVLAVASLPVSWIPSVQAMLGEHGARPRGVFEQLRTEFLSSGRPYVSLDSTLPVMLGDRPIVLDDFGLRLQVLKRTPGGLDFERRLKARDFSAVIMRDGGLFPTDMNYGDPGFAERVQQWRDRYDDALTIVVQHVYEVRASRRPYLVLMPAR